MKTKHLYIIICTLLFITFIIFMLSAFKNISYTANADISEKLPTVIVDAGHGGEDGGCVALDGTLEKDINLKISNKIASILENFGFDVIKIRDDDKSIYDDTAKTISQKKVSDLHNRVDIFNSDDNNVVLSIHQNKFDDSKYHGTQVFYSNNNESSKELADCIKNSITNLIQKDNDRECKKADSSIFILDKTSVPAVIVECGFLSNGEEREKLKTEKYQDEIAYSICLGFLEYYNQNS